MWFHNQPFLRKKHVLQSWNLASLYSAARKLWRIQDFRTAGIFLIFHLKNSEFQCIMGSILSQFSCPFYSKKQCFWLPELANESTACKERANDKTPVGNNICMKWNGLSGVSGPNMAYLKMKPHNLLQQLSKFVISIGSHWIADINWCVKQV